MLAGPESVLFVVRAVVIRLIVVPFQYA